MDCYETRWRMPSYVFILLLVCVGLIFYVDIFQLQSFQISTSDRLLEKLEKDDVQGFLIKTEGCRIPYMDPFDSAVTKFITKVKPIVCNKNKPPLMESNLTGIYLLNTSLAAYNINNITDLKCCYTIFKRVDSKPNQGDNQISFGKCIQFNNSVLIDTEFVKVTCTYSNESIYKDFFSFVPIKPKFKNLTISSGKLNVLIVGLDAVSRINFHRQMPVTAQLIKELGAIEFLGYNKVADNTFPNLVPVLTGLYQNELAKKCWHKHSDKFDNCNFIWNNYSSNGFATAFGEDATWMGIFNYVKRGFGKQPTDYYWGPFDSVAEKQIGNAHDMNVYQCIGSREVYRVLLDYMNNYVSSMDQNKVPYFGLFWGGSLSHDYLNKPQLGDKYYVNFFRKLFEMGALNNMVLIFMSDHGIRWGDIRSTYQGRMEERLPFLFMIFPKTYREEYRQIFLNLKKNSRRLTTPFDLHETLKDLLNPFELSQTEINRRISARKGNERAYSLFEPIPDNRTCANAQISNHWCTCQVSTEININETVVMEIANFTVKHLNKLLEGYAECAKLSLAEIYNARVHSSEKQLQANSYTLDYTIGFRTDPGGGKFEATIRRIVNKKKPGFSVVGTISQLKRRMDKDDLRWRPPALLLIPLFLCGIFIFYVDVFQLTTFKISTFKLPRPRFVGQLDNVNLNDDFLVKTEGCRIPYLNPFDPSISQFIFNEDKVVCNHNKPPLVDSNLTHIFILEESLTIYDIINVDALKCCFSIFRRVIPNAQEHDNKIFFSKCITFKNNAKIKTQFVRVTCSYNANVIYTDFFSFVPLPNLKSSFHTQDPFINVLVVGLDAVSRINLHRQMPKTVEVLRNINAVEFLGYNKIADNTFPNVVPILTGLSEKELVEDCWPHVTDKFDNCSFIWKSYSKIGHITAFGEDSAWMGMFNYAKFGFLQQPTDYFWDSFNYQSEKHIGNEHRMNVDQCVGSREVYTVLLDYITKLITTMQTYNHPFFGFFWGSSLSHDYLNKPKLGDENYAAFIKNLATNDYLKNTVFMFISDHGIRWGGIRATYQGRMEERLPFLFISLPESYREKYYVAYTNLKKNARRLTTPFDLYKTLEDLISPDSLAQDVISLRVRNRKGDEREYSLFEPIPTNRTCLNAGIAPHWCTCQSSTDIKRNSDIVVEVVNFSIDYINTKLKGYAECAKLKLLDVLSAREHAPVDVLLEPKHSIDYTIVFKTLPGEGVFEATVRKHFHESGGNHYFKMTGTVSRINLYGSQSSCMTDFHLKLYCYCI
ncbi:hypothetical protein FQR65_LT01182 [Abscondita terminalis]|nr:hypothetical protein FQR65_LT01182 [Abscondita terminalis]